MTVLEATAIKKTFRTGGLFQKKSEVRALKGVSLSLKQGETLAIVGESGCGKSTLAKILLQIETPDSGDILFSGKEAAELTKRERFENIQMIFQDPYGSLNPRKKAWQIISEPLKINRGLSNSECRHEAKELMLKVGLRPEYCDRYPHMFSGGQRQRIGIARALALQPKILVCDEPVSALDVSIQAQILNLLVTLQRELNLSYIFISHDLSVVRHFADRVLVINRGEIVESGTREEIFGSPKDAYTKKLLASTPKLVS